MATLTIRGLPQEVYDWLRSRAVENRRSMEAEACAVLAEALPPKLSLEEALRKVDEMVARMPPEAREKLSVDSFLAERRAMWGEEE